MQRKQFVEELNIVTTFQTIALAYEQISVIKMQQIRNFVLQTRDFLEGLSGVFYDVKSSYRNQIIALAKKNVKKRKKTKEPQVIRFSTLVKNGKSVTVLLSANTKLYGEIVPQTVNSFMATIAQDTSDIVIVGKLGKHIIDQAMPNRAYAYFELPDDKVTFDDLKDLISHIVSYEKVTVFYGKFINVVSQAPTSTTISGEEPMNLAKKPEAQFRFIFEPNLEKILNFFETQIFTSLFQQTIQESQLARHASRIRAMEQALSNINPTIRELNSLKRRSKQSLMNKKQIELLAGISLWNKP